MFPDLKPDNVLLDKDGHLRVSDFGLSVELKEKNGFKIRGNAGTSGYLAPELCTNEPYGLSCDFWTLGKRGSLPRVGLRWHGARTRSRLSARPLRWTRG